MTDRPTRLLDALGDRAELMLVTSLVNVRYLTGFTGSHGVAVIGPQTRVFLTDSRYTEQAAAEVDPSFDRRTIPGAVHEVIAGLVGDGEPRLAFEDAVLTVREHTELRGALPDRVTLVAAGHLVEGLRAVKDADEIDRIRAASALADEALLELMEQGIVGRTEAAVALALDDAMRARGASGTSFDTIVASGPHGALPHAVPRDVEIAAGQLVVVDWDAVLDGYCSDCTRTVATGPLSDAATAVYELVLEAQLAGLEAIAPGAEGRAVDAAAREVIDAAGHGEHFGHSLGHGVGLEVHELPRLSQRTDDRLSTGNVVSCEPGVYVPGELGVRIEDLCVVTESGAERLTHIPKSLTTLG